VSGCSVVSWTFPVVLSPTGFCRGLDVFCFLPCLSQNLHHFLFVTSLVDFG
jgi:hypothetical protein